MPSVIVCTNFSETSRNALSYACSLIYNKSAKEGISILLLNVYTIPATYSGDGMALVTIDNALNYAEEDLHAELEWVNEEYPDLNVIGKVSTGRLPEVLSDEIHEMEASMVIIGAGGNYGELWSWDSNILHVLRNLTAPVLTIPPRVAFTPLQNIAFACNLKNIGLHSPFAALKKIIAFTEAKLHIVYVTESQTKPGSKEAENEALVHQTLKDIEPVYHVLYENEVISAIGHFVDDKQIQLLLVMPSKHGVWENLFRKSYTKELTRINYVPVMALH